MVLPRHPQAEHMIKMVGVSLALHMALVALLGLNPRLKVINMEPSIYEVTLMPISHEDLDIRNTQATSEMKKEIPKFLEKVKPLEKLQKKDDIVEKVKKRPIPERDDKEKASLQRLQEAMDEIRKKAALDEIQKRVVRREKREERLKEEQRIRVSAVSATKAALGLETIESEYYSRVWTKIKEVWTIPENLIKEMVDLETVIVLIIDREGKVQKSWYEKKSGNEFFDQMAMRAIKKAEPLSPIPKEFGKDSLEIGIRFFPE